MKYHVDHPRELYRPNFDSEPKLHEKKQFGEISPVDSVVAFKIGRFPVQTSLGDRSGLGTHPCYAGPIDPRVIIVKTQWLTPIKWGCPHDNGPKLAVGQRNRSWKNKGPVIIHDAHVTTRTIPNMTIVLHATLSSRFVKVKISFRWNKFYTGSDVYRGSFTKRQLMSLDPIMKWKANTASKLGLNTDQKNSEYWHFSLGETRYLKNRFLLKVIKTYFDINSNDVK